MVVVKGVAVFLADKIVFPISRWYWTNSFLSTLKGHGEKNDCPSLLWNIFGRAYWACSRLANQVRLQYYNSVVKNYSALVKKHYLGNIAYRKDAISREEYKDHFKAVNGSMEDLLKDPNLMAFAGIRDGDSFLECGSGPGWNIKAILQYLPSSKVKAFDLSPNAVEFAKDYFKGKNVEMSQGSVLDMEFLNSFPDKSIDNVFFANMLATVMDGDIEQTRKTRKRILGQAARIARKNVILDELFVNPEKIYVEQRFRAHFQEDYSRYFDDRTDGFSVKSKHFAIFHKTV